MGPVGGEAHVEEGVGAVLMGLSPALRRFLLEGGVIEEEKKCYCGVLVWVWGRVGGVWGGVWVWVGGMSVVCVCVCVYVPRCVCGGVGGEGRGEGGLGLRPSETRYADNYSVCVRACVRVVCVRACVCACLRLCACVRACVLFSFLYLFCSL